MKLLDAQKIKQKTQRIAIEILENNSEENQIILAGVNSNGMAFARMLFDVMSKVDIIEPEIIMTKISLNPANPVSDKVTVGLPLIDLKGKTIILVDDVANTGRTLQYAMKPLLDILPKKIELLAILL